MKGSSNGSSKDSRDAGRRDFLKRTCMYGAGVLWAISPRLLKAEGNPGMSASAGGLGTASGGSADNLTFIQISDTHMGFKNDPNKDVVGTLREVVAQVNAIPKQPDFILHTGDLSHLSKPEEFDTLDQVLADLKVKKIRYIPGEHDVIGDDGKLFFSRYAKEAASGGWYSFDQKGVHFVALVNVLNRPATGLGHLGQEQLDWVKGDLKGVSRSTPVVVFAHIPLWNIYPAWGWGTEDVDPLMAQLKEFEDVAVLNGHIHQIQQKVDGKVLFHTARSTAYPQPQPGAAPKPGPLVVPPEELRGYLGLRRVDYAAVVKKFGVTDTALAAPSSSEKPKQAQVEIKDFAFKPDTLSVAVGTTVTWVNRDTDAHSIMSTEKSFTKEGVPLDTDQTFSYTFTQPGTYHYYCTIHTEMRGAVIVK